MFQFSWVTDSGVHTHNRVWELTLRARSGEERRDIAMWRPAAVELRMVSEDTRSGAAAATLLAIMPVKPKQPRA